MRVAVIGATGVFGSRLVRLLRRDGHEVVAVARGAAALARLAAETGAELLLLERAGDLAPLWAVAPAAVVDAAGPFHAYGADPYRLARECVARGVHYLDLADDAGFCAGIAGLDAAARAAGVAVLSGVSSVPALSSSVVAALTEGMESIDTVDTAILPGNRTPRGRAVVEGILARTGRPFAGWVDGKRVAVRNWSGPVAYVLAPGMRRVGWQIEVPDQRLLPAAFDARTVTVRGGLELALMARGLAALSWLRGRLGFTMPGWLVASVYRVAAVLEPFGSDEGGMVVTVTGRVGEGWVRREWRLVVRRGDGPFVPGVAARAVLRDIAAVPAGARPALAVVPLAACEAAMAGLAVEVARGEAPVVPLFARVPGFGGLPAAVKAAHDHAGPRRFTGEAVVERGHGVVARLLAVLFRFPAAGEGVPVEVLKWPVEGGEVWERCFAWRRFRSVLKATPAGITERFGPFTFLLGLRAGGGELAFPVAAGWLLGVPLPRGLLPASVAREYAEGGRFRFDVALHAPLGLGLVVRYRGWLVHA